MCLVFLGVVHSGPPPRPITTIICQLMLQSPPCRTWLETKSTEMSFLKTAGMDTKKLYFHLILMKGGGGKGVSAPQKFS